MFEQVMGKDLIKWQDHLDERLFGIKIYSLVQRNAHRFSSKNWCNEWHKIGVTDFVYVTFQLKWICQSHSFPNLKNSKLLRFLKFHTVSFAWLAFQNRYWDKVTPLLVWICYRKISIDELKYRAGKTCKKRDLLHSFIKFNVCRDVTPFISTLPLDLWKDHAFIFFINIPSFKTASPLS